MWLFKDASALPVWAALPVAVVLVAGSALAGGAEWPIAVGMLTVVGWMVWRRLPTG